MSNEEERDDLKRVSLRERSRQWFITIGTALALLATIIGFLSDSVGVVEFMQDRLGGASLTPTVTIDDMAARSSGMLTQTKFVVTPPELSTATAAVNVAATATPVLTPSPTPLPVMAAENEQLLIVAQFTNFAVDANYNVAGRIEEALSAQVGAARLADTRVAVWPDVILDARDAAAVRDATGALMVIWGEYDSGRVRVNFAIEGGGAELEWQRLLGAPTELSTTINLDVPRETQALALMALGRLYRNAGDLARARAAFGQALAQQPSGQDTVATLTFYLAVLDASATPPELDRAIEGYSKVIEMRPEWFNARYNRGLAHLTRYWLNAERADLASAIDDFSWTIDAKRNYAEAYINRAIAYYARNDDGDLAASVDDLTSAIRYSKNSYRAYYNRGLAYIRLNQRADWESDLQRALSLEPNFWVSHHALCWGYALDQMPDEGLPHCDEARAHDPSGSTLDGRGLILAEQGQLEAAAADLTSYLAWLDTQPEVWSELNNRGIYEEILAGLHAGENRVTADLLAKLR